MNFTVIGDEIAYSFEKQLEILTDLKIPNIEIRKIDGFNSIEFSVPKIYEIAQIIQKNQVSVSLISTDIGKRPRTAKETFKAFERGLDNANILNCKYIRIFSDLTPNIEDNIFLIRKLLAMAESKRVIILLENEINTFAYSPSNCKWLLNLFNGSLRLLYDPGNFFKCKYSVSDSYEMLKRYISYIHITDMKEKNFEWTEIGNGDVAIYPLLTRLYKEGFEGYISLEPHFYIDDSKKRADSFVKYYKNFRSYIKNMRKMVE